MGGVSIRSDKPAILVSADDAEAAFAWPDGAFVVAELALDADL
jgi:hypothetical protein